LERQVLEFTIYDLRFTIYDLRAAGRSSGSGNPARKRNGAEV
jgi:hypothetical protein